MSTQMFNVTKTSQMTNLHPQTLRHWEKIGLIVPSRTLGGVRRYSEFDIQKLNEIRELSARGVNLEGISIILNLHEENNILRRQLSAGSKGTVFVASEGGIFVEQGTKMSLRDQLRLWRMIHRKSNRVLPFEQLQIENR